MGQVLVLNIILEVNNKLTNTKNKADCSALFLLYEQLVYFTTIITAYAPSYTASSK